jgi:hypothetical protein
MPLPMLPVHAACPQTVSLWTIKFAVFFKGECLQTHYAVIFLIAKIMEVMFMVCQPPEGHTTAAKAEVSIAERGHGGG